MSQGDYVRINNKNEIQEKLRPLFKRIEGWDYLTPLVIRLEPYQDTRTHSQNNLFHSWCKQISDEYIKKNPEVDLEGVKWWMKKQFLQSKTIKVGKTIIEDQLPSTASLSKGEMCFFMDQVYAWAAEKRIFLSLPKYNEYSELKRKQEK